MSKNESYWERFEKTGDVRDYLNYTACTKEACLEDEGKDNDWDDCCERDGAVSHANGRV